MIQITVEKNLIALEDLLLGTGTATQSRAGANVTVNKINAANFPYDGTDTLQTKIDWLDSQYNYIVANTSTAFDHSTLIRKHLTNDYLIKADGTLFVPRIEETASAAEATYAGKLWVKTISATEAHLKRGSDLLAKFNPTSHAQIIDLDYPTIISTVTSALGSAAVEDVGTDPGDIVQLDVAGKLPPVDGSQLLNLPIPADTGVPIGGVVMWTAATAPTGYKLCDGSAISRTTYADLFAVIDETYGIGDGSTTFNLPDFRGYFPRGNDNGRGVDIGRVLGTEQADTVVGHTHAAGTLATASSGSHSHTIGYITDTGSGGIRNLNTEVKTSTANVTTNSSGAHTHTISGSTASTGDSETRPKNLSINFIIRYA